MTYAPRRRSLPLPLPLLLLGLTLGAASPCLAEDAPWLPLKDGRVWRFRLTESVKSAGQSAQQSSTVALVCGAAEDHDGAPAWPLTFRDGSKSATVRGLYRSSATAVELVESSARTPGLLPADFSGKTETREIKVGGATVVLTDQAIEKPAAVTVQAPALEAE